MCVIFYIFIYTNIDVCIYTLLHKQPDDADVLLGLVTVGTFIWWHVCAGVCGFVCLCIYVCIS